MDHSCFPYKKKLEKKVLPHPRTGLYGTYQLYNHESDINFFFKMSPYTSVTSGYWGEFSPSLGYFLLLNKAMPNINCTPRGTSTENPSITWIFQKFKKNPKILKSDFFLFQKIPDENDDFSRKKALYCFIQISN